jgi:hypothetical protein
MKKCFNGAHLKSVAVISMAIDHIGCVLVWSMYISAGENKEMFLTLYYICRCIGRLAFPIFAYFLVEGFTKTRNIKKYAIRLFAFAVLSEIPFNLAFYDKLFYPDSQNVIWTYFTALILLWMLKDLGGAVKENHGDTVYKIFCGILIFVARLAAETFDGGVGGIIMTAGLYIRQESPIMKMLSLVVGVAILTLLSGSHLQWLALLSIPLISMYNGQKGKYPKYFFYIFYPGHLLILYFLKNIL